MFAHGRLRCEARLSTSWVARCAALSAVIDSELARGAAELRAAGSSGTLWGWWLGGGRVGGGFVRELRERAQRVLEAMKWISEEVAEGLVVFSVPLSLSLFFFFHSLTSTCLADISCGIRLCVWFISKGSDLSCMVSPCHLASSQDKTDRKTLSA